MEEYIHRKNLERFRSLLDQVSDERQRKQIERLIAEEESRSSSPKSVPLNRQAGLDTSLF